MGDLSPGTVFAGHRIEAVAGRGGMGVVYRATQLALDRTVALKVIAPGLLEDASIRHRFVRESKVAASIDHPNVIPIYYTGEEDGIAYIAMRYVAGDDVRSRVRREGRLKPERAARIVAQIGAALDEAHAAGLVHRDIKPANVLLTQDDHVYLTDFGLTKHTVSVAGSTKPGHWVGTLDYVAPEQIRGERVDARADVYSLGCLLYFTLTGEVPFRRDGDGARLWAHLSDPPPKPSEQELPEAFDEVIERALAKDPDERYPSAGDLGRAAVAAAANERPADPERLVAKGAAAPVESPTVTSPVRGRTTTRRRPESETTPLVRRSRRRTAAMAAAALALVATAVVLALTRGDEPAPPVARTPTPTPTPTPTATPDGPRTIRTVEVGRRPNVVRIVDGTVFVGSFLNDRLNLVSAKTGKLRSYAPKIGVGISDAVVVKNAVWVAVSRAHQIVRLSAKTGHPIGDPIAVPTATGAITYGGGAIWAALIPGQGLPDQLLKIEPETGQILATTSYPYGIQSLAASPSALWIAARRWARIQRVDFSSGDVQEIRVGNQPSEDIVYSRGAVWAATPEDDTVNKIDTKTGEVIPISVGNRPRQLAVTRDRVYVTNYNSSDLRTIDVKRMQVTGDPYPLSVNPFSLAVDGDRVWVASQPENLLAEVAIDRGG